MNEPTTNNPTGGLSPDEWGERISAYLDGELSPTEAAEVERRLAEDPEARGLADALRTVSQACRESPAEKFETDLSRTVLAEALRRQALGEGASVDEQKKADLLEPEGEYGLPFGKMAGGWSWLGVAVAAALLISFWGRPDRPSGQPTIAKATPPATSRQENYAKMLAALQQAAPVQVRNVRATPQMLAALQQRLSMQSPQRAQLPSELMNVSQRGLVVKAADPELSASAEGEELVYVDASEEEIDRLLADLQRKGDGGLHTVEPNRSSPAPRGDGPVAQPSVAATQSSATAPRAVRVRLQLKPGSKISVSPLPPRADGRKLVLLRIQMQPDQK